jgi:hypothetical protein
MIMRIDLKEPKAKEVIDELCKHISFRFTKIIDGEATFRYNFFDDLGYEYNREIYLRASKNNKAILIYINYKEFPNFVRGYPLEDDIQFLIAGYIDSVMPNILMVDLNEY